MEQLHEDVKEIKREVVSIRVLVEKNTTSLEHHIKRTDIAELRLKQVETYLLGLMTSIVMSGVYYFLKR